MTKGKNRMNDVKAREKEAKKRTNESEGKGFA